MGDLDGMLWELEAAESEAEAFDILAGGFAAALRTQSDGDVDWLAHRAPRSRRAAWALSHLVWDGGAVVGILGLNLVADAYIRYGPPPGGHWQDGWADGALRGAFESEPASWCVSAISRVLNGVSDDRMIEWIGADLVEELLRFRREETEPLLVRAAADAPSLRTALAVAERLVP